ncbi:hypothetical protein ACER0C_023312 [Sarotherodon galilaeus]
MELIHPILLLILCNLLQCWGVHRSSSQLLLRQKRNWIIDSFTIDEGYQGPFPYSLGKIEVEKDLVLFMIQGQGVDEEPTQVLEINPYTGEIKVLRSVDCEQYQTLKLKFKAFDRENHELETQLGIYIEILDSNDNPPKFLFEEYTFTIKESTLQGTEVGRIQATDQDISEKYNKVRLKIVSVEPKPKDVEFYFKEIDETGLGVISFKGCLDHETAEKYTIIVEAKDNGEKPQSSSCTIIINIEDGNNHLPVITKQTGQEKVKEGQTNVLVSRIHVHDEDTRGTPAWRAKYTIQGDTNNNFRITTDPETNDGLLHVEKPLNYEDGALKNITITVENEIPYYSCKVEKRSTTGLWKVVTTSVSAATGSAVSFVTGTVPSSHQVIVTVEDVNEPPVFDKTSIETAVPENVKEGQYLATVTAKDPDVANKNTFKYMIGHDPAGWIKVDPDTGNITTSKPLDRESEFVKDNIYVVTICAVDDGKPQMTSTATLSIYVRDDNDHTPYLVVSTIEMCQSDGQSFANITALDSDVEPYSGPFTFKLHGDVEGKWKIDPVTGYSVNLVKESTVHSDHHELLLEVSDQQGKSAFHNLSVTVCSCLDSEIPNCHVRTSGTTLGAGGVGIILLAMLLITGLLLLALLMSCEKQILEIKDGLSSEQQLMKSNTENPGTDCPVAIVNQNGNEMQEISQVTTVKTNPVFLLNDSETNSEFLKYQKESSMAQPFIRGSFMHMSQRGSNMGMGYHQGQSVSGLMNEAVHGGLQMNSLTSQYKGEGSGSAFIRGNFMRKSLGAISNSGMTHLQWQSRHGLTDEAIRGTSQTGTRGSFMRTSLGASSNKGMAHLQVQSNHGMYMGLDHRNQLLNQVIPTMINTLQEPGKELGDYVPHVYNEEGDTEHNFELDAISIADVSFDPEMYLCDKFTTLASICMPSDVTTVQKIQTATLVQEESHELNWQKLTLNEVYISQ